MHTITGRLHKCFRLEDIDEVKPESERVVVVVCVWGGGAVKVTGGTGAQSTLSFTGWVHSVVVSVAESMGCILFLHYAPLSS